MKRQHSKYHAQKVKVGNIEFDSKKEAQRWAELRLLERAGKIKDLQRQVRFELIPAQYEEITTYTPKTHKEKREQKLVERKLIYIADFVYTDKNGDVVVEDVKGYRDSVAYNIFVIKRKLMLYVYGIRIKEI